ncbi:MAG: hypothetical protein JW834_02340 [Candidatus Diapherotrites archaeon]|nr:hypothetical protein [Candidatus Diapherotrites archaeon]
MAMSRKQVRKKLEGTGKRIWQRVHGFGKDLGEINLVGFFSMKSITALPATEAAGFSGMYIMELMEPLPSRGFEARSKELVTDTHR